MDTRRAIVVIVSLLGLAACKGPFSEVRRGGAEAPPGIVAYCGASAVTAAGVIKTMDELGRSEAALPAPEEVTICVEVKNDAATPLRVDRSHAKLKCPRERQTWVPDAQDQELVVPPGHRRRFRVTFHYSPLLSGEDVELLLDGVLSRGRDPVTVAPIVLRRR